MSGWILTTTDGRQVNVYGHHWEVDGVDHEFEEITGVEAVVEEAGNDWVFFEDGVGFATDERGFLERLRRHLGVTWDESTSRAIAPSVVVIGPRDYLSLEPLEFGPPVPLMRHRFNARRYMAGTATLTAETCWCGQRAEALIHRTENV